MDDVILLGNDKRCLKVAARSLDRYLRRRFGLSLKPWKVSRTGSTEPLDLGGWVTRYRSSVIRSGTFLRSTRAYRRFSLCPSPRRAKTCTSYWGWYKHGDLDRVRRDRRIGEAFAHARAVASRHDRLEASHATDAIIHAA